MDEESIRNTISKQMKQQDFEQLREVADNLDLIADEIRIYNNMNNR